MGSISVSVLKYATPRMSPADGENVSVPLLIVKQHRPTTVSESQREGHEGERTAGPGSMRGLDE